MTEKDINKCLKSSISEIAPDCFDAIMKKTASREDIQNPEKKVKKNTRNYLVSIAACFVLFAGAYGFYQHDLHQITTVIELDVNPSIEFYADKADRVIKVKALNDDAEKVIEKVSLEKENIQKATLKIMDELVEEEYISKEKSTILISVENECNDKTEQIKESLSREIVRYLEKDDIKVNVIRQTMTEDDITESIAKEYGISKGKALLVKTVLEENDNLKEEELAKMTVDEIARQVEWESVNNKDNFSQEKNKSNEKKKTITETASQKKENNGEKKNHKNSLNEKQLKSTEKLKSGEKVKPTKEPQNEEKAKPTKLPQVKEKAKPTKEPQNEEKAKPTKLPQVEEKAKPTKEPNHEEKAKSTKEPNHEEKAKPTKLPQVEEKAKPTNEPNHEEKAKPTKEPNHEQKAKPTKLPEEYENIKQTPYPEGDERKPPENEGSEDNQEHNQHNSERKRKK